MAIEYVDSTQLDSDLTAVANAIRAKSGGSTPLVFPGGFVSEIGSIQTGGGGGGAEVTAISSALNATSCRALLFPGAVDNHLYVAVLKSPVSGTKIENQMEFLFSVGPRGSIGGGVRWRNNGHATFNMYETYDAKIQTGDVYLCYDYPLV